MATRSEIVKVLRQELPSIGVEALEETSARRVIGFVVDDFFTKLDHRDRQRHIWSILDKHLGRENLRNVGPIAVLTRYEAGLQAAQAD